jgi:hypothetical protein
MTMRALCQLHTSALFVWQKETFDALYVQEKSGFVAKANATRTTGMKWNITTKGGR